ncbi:MAG: hypothetical protein AAF438_18040 [Pseudomonadota bacterium]
MSEDTIVKLLTFSLMGLLLACAGVFTYMSLLLRSAKESAAKNPELGQPAPAWLWMVGSCLYGLIWGFGTFATMGFGMSHGGFQINETAMFAALYLGPIVYVILGIVIALRVRERFFGKA